MAFDWLDDDRQPLQFIISVSEVAIAGLMLLLMLSVWVYVLVRARRRGGGKLYLPRASLGMLGILWMLAVFFSHVALWDVLGAADVVGVELTRDKELVCQVTLSVSLGLAEPAFLALVGEVIRLKTAGEGARYCRALRRLSPFRRACVVALPFALLQSALMITTALDPHLRYIQESPEEAKGVSAAKLFLPLPPIPLECDDAALDQRCNASWVSEEYEAGSGGEEIAFIYPWWHEEGCAVSIASLSLNAVFVLLFEFFWTLWCLPPLHSSLLIASFMILLDAVVPPPLNYSCTTNSVVPPPATTAIASRSRVSIRRHIVMCLSSVEQ
mmetsp:Transcript_24401/g.71310  ORF Transcript_24401/g.71310 Transcript_24401/m.71310 type:complete len:327 (-) Transcript_24401:644-1624(-)